MDSDSQEWMQICFARWCLVNIHTKADRFAWLNKMENKRGKRWREDFELVLLSQWKRRKEWMHETNELYRRLRDETAKD